MIIKLFKKYTFKNIYASYFYYPAGLLYSGNISCYFIIIKFYYLLFNYFKALIGYKEGNNKKKDGKKEVPAYLHLI